MNEKKEYLNEEWYQGAKKKITKISLIILVVSLLLGVGLITVGIIKTNSAKKEANQINEQKKLTAESRLKEIAVEKEELNKQYDTKEQQCDSLNMNDADWYTKTNQCDRESSAIEAKINELEIEETKLNNEDYSINFDAIAANRYHLFSFFGVIIILTGVTASLMFYIFAKRREITAFTAQQVMPVAQEGIEKMAPTIGNAAGSIAKGIKEGLQEAEMNKPTVESDTSEQNLETTTEDNKDSIEEENNPEDIQQSANEEESLEEKTDSENNE